MPDGLPKRPRQKSAASLCAARLPATFRWVLLAVLGCTLISGPHSRANQPPEKSTAEALDAFASAANLQNNGQFDLAAEEWADFLKRYAKDPLVPKARHYLAVCRIQLKQYAPAEALLVEVTKDPKFPLLEESLLNLGFCRYAQGKAGNKEKFREAISAFRSQLKQFPQGKLADQALYFQGESWFELEDWQKAAVVYKALLDHFPQSRLRCDAWYALGTAYEGQQKWKEATAAYDEFLQNCASDPDVNAVKFRKAETLVPQGQFDEALKIYDELAQIDGFADATAAAMGAASCLFQKGDYAASAKRYLALAQRLGDDPLAITARLSAGKAFYRARQYDDAESALRDVVAGDQAAKWEAAHWLARIALAKGDPAGAIKVLDSVGAAPAQDPFAVSLQLDRADALFDSGNLDAAYSAYVQLADAHGKHDLAEQARFNAAVTALQLGQAANAQAQARQFIRDYPEADLLADARFVLAESLLLAGDAAAAEKEYTSLLKDFPRHKDAARFALRRAAAWYMQKDYDRVVTGIAELLPQLAKPADKAQAEFLLGVSLFGKKDFAEAAKHLRASVLADAKWSQADEALLFLGRAQAADGKADLAKETFRSLIRGYPNSALLAQAYYRLGEVLYQTGGFAEAAQAYAQCLAKQPSGELAPYALSGQGWSLLKKGDYAAAEEVFSKLIQEHGETQPGREALLARGMCRRQQKQLDAALDDLNKFIAENETSSLLADALYERGLTLVGLKRNDDAAGTFRELLKQFPKYGQRDRVLFELAWALKGDHEQEAVAAFEQLVREHPDSPLVAESSFQIGEARYQAKKYAEAADAYRTAQKLAKTADVGELATYKLGWALYHQGKYAEAAKQFAAQTATYQQGPLYADGLFMLGECEFKLGHYDVAWKSFVAADAFPPRSPQIGALLRLHGAQSAGQLGKWDDARKWLKKLIQDQPESPLLPEALYELGRASHELGDLEAARSAWEDAAAKAKTVIAVQAQFMLGELAFEQKQFDEAEKEFRRAMFRFGAEKAPKEFHAWQAKAAFEAARCHEVRIRDAKNAAERIRHLQEADRFYRHVVDKYPQSDVAEAARKRLAALAQLR